MLSILAPLKLPLVIIYKHHNWCPFLFIVQSKMPNLQKMKITMLLTRPVVDSYLCVCIDVTCYVVAQLCVLKTSWLQSWTLTMNCDVWLDRVVMLVMNGCIMYGWIAPCLSRIFSANEQYFSLTTNQPTVLSAMAYQPNEQGTIWGLYHSNGEKTATIKSTGSACELIHCDTILIAIRV